MIINQQLDLEGTQYYTINYHEFNRMLIRDNNVMFFLNLKTILKQQKKSFMNIIHNFSDEVISRIFYESLGGINVQEAILEEIIIPAFVWCVKNNRTSLITPYFRLFDYMTMGMHDVITTVDYLANIIALLIINDLKIEYYNMSDGMMPFVTKENADDIESHLLTITDNELRKFSNPAVDLYLSTNDFQMDIIAIFRKSLTHHMTSQLSKGMYEIGFEMNITPFIESSISASLNL